MIYIYKSYMYHTNNVKFYKFIIYKFIFKLSIFIIAITQSYYSFIDNDQYDKIFIDHPYSAYTSILFICINTNLFIEIPLIILGINSFLVWSISQNRISVINFLDLICILWVMLCYISCLNYTKIYDSIFRYRLCNNIRYHNLDEHVEHNFLYSYVNYEYLLIPINICFISFITIVLNTSIKEPIIDILNNNIHVIVGSLIICSLLVVPQHYNNKKFLTGFFIMTVGFFVKLLYMFDIMDIDIATGMFHTCISISCQLFSIVIDQ